MYKYDVNSNLIEENALNSYGDLIEGEYHSFPSKKIYKYDSNNNLTEYLQFNYEGFLTDGDSGYYSPSRVVYKYDVNNNLIEEMRYNIKNELFVYRSYDEDESIYKIPSKIIYKYTPHLGKLIMDEIEYYNHKDELINTDKFKIILK